MLKFAGLKEKVSILNFKETPLAKNKLMLKKFIYNL